MYLHDPGDAVQPLLAPSARDPPPSPPPADTAPRVLRFSTGAGGGSGRRPLALTHPYYAPHPMHHLFRHHSLGSGAHHTHPHHAALLPRLALACVLCVAAAVAPVLAGSSGARAVTAGGLRRGAAAPRSVESSEGGGEGEDGGADAMWSSWLAAPAGATEGPSGPAADDDTPAWEETPVWEELEEEGGEAAGDLPAPAAAGRQGGGHRRDRRDGAPPSHPPPISAPATRRRKRGGGRPKSAPLPVAPVAPVPYVAAEVASPAPVSDSLPHSPPNSATPTPTPVPTPTPTPTHTTPPPSAGRPPLPLAEARSRAAWVHACLEGGDVTGATRAPQQGRTPVGSLLLDADELRAHAFEVHGHLAPYRRLARLEYAGYAGPWVENHWIAAFGTLPVRRNVSAAWWDLWAPRLAEAGVSVVEGALPAGAPVTPGRGDPAPPDGRPPLTIEEPFDFDAVYPLVPLFAQWEDWYAYLFARGAGGYAAGMQAAHLRRALRADVQYVTVTQRASGLLALTTSAAVPPPLSNILVLSAGGGGQVALPLLKDDAVGSPPPPPGGDRPFRMAFQGKAHHAELRGGMLRGVEALARARGWAPGADYVLDGMAPPPCPQEEAVGRPRPPSPTSPARPRPDGPPLGWTGVLARTQLALTPRGTGPTSFRLFEALALGAVPVYVWDGGHAPWLPYWWPAGEGDPSASWRRGAPPSLPLIPPLTRQRLLRELGMAPHATGGGGVGALSWRDMAFIVHARDLPRWLMEDAPAVLEDRARLAAMRAAGARAVAAGAFTYAGVMERVRSFLADVRAPHAPLQCTAAAALALV